MIRAVIFDFNGVIVDDEHLHFLLFRDVLGEIGIGLDEARYKADYLGFDDRGCLSAALRDAGRVVDAGLVDALILDKARRYVVAAERDLHFFPGAGEIISRMADCGPVAICSGALRAEIDYALGRLGVSDRVVGIVSAEDTSRCKPDPEGYLLALDKLQLVANEDLLASECLAIEDSLAGVAAARSAGMVVVGVSNTYGAVELLGAGAAEVVGSLLDLDLAALGIEYPHPNPLPGYREKESDAAPSRGTPGEDSGGAFHSPLAASSIALLITRDLIFTSKITGTAAALSRKVHIAGNLAVAAAIIAAHRPSLILIDLTAGDAADADAIGYLRALAPTTTFLAFGPHVDVLALDSARKAGVEHVMPRSKFAAELPEILRRLLPLEVGK